MEEKTQKDLQYLQFELAKIQQKLNAPKDLKNTFGGYTYRNAEGILAAVKPLLPEGVYITTDSTYRDNKCYCTVAIHYGTASISAIAYAGEATEKKGMDIAQISGAAYSYARKYALGGLFAIDDSRDDPDAHDNTVIAPKQTKTGDNRPAPKIDTGGEEESNYTLLQKLKALGADITKLPAYYKVNSLEDLTAIQLQHAIAIKKKKIGANYVNTL